MVWRKLSATKNVTIKNLFSTETHDATTTIVVITIVVITIVVIINRRRCSITEVYLHVELTQPYLLQYVCTF